MGSKFTKHDLQTVSDYIEFESFCHDLMSREGYKDIEPLGGQQDKGRDAVHISRSTGEVTIFAYSVRADWAVKLNEDLSTIVREQHDCTHVVFVTTQRPTAGQKDVKRNDVKAKYGWSLDFYDLERIATLVDSQYQDLIELHPGIFPFSLHEGSNDDTDLGIGLDKTLYAELMLSAYNEWQERYTPLLADYREIPTFLVPSNPGRAPAEPISVERIHEVSELSVILGEAGAGKTTAIWRIIVNCSEALIAGSGQRIPVMIPMRSWERGKCLREIAQDAFSFLGVSEAALEDELRAGNCLILIDGLNEVSLDHSVRSDAHTDLKRFLRTYARNRFVICSRASDYDSEILDPENLTPRLAAPKVYEIRRLSKGQIVEYAKRNIRNGSAGDFLERLRVDDNEAWENPESLIHLARIPLYLQLLIAQFSRSGELPSSQARLLKTLFEETMRREGARSAASVTTSAKERLLGGVAYRSTREGYSLRMPNSLVQDALSDQVNVLKGLSLVLDDISVTAVWQELLSNNLIRDIDGIWVEWLHQLLLDYFLGCEITRIWTAGNSTEVTQLVASLTRLSWGQACAVALGLLGPMSGARLLEELLRIDRKLGQEAFEGLSEEEEKRIAEVILANAFADADPEGQHLCQIVVKLPYVALVESLRVGFRFGDGPLRERIAEAICRMVITHYPEMAGVHGDYGALSRQRLGRGVKRGLELLAAWSANRNEIVTFFAAMGLRQTDPGRSAEALRRLYETGSTATVKKVKDLMDDWGIT